MKKGASTILSILSLTAAALALSCGTALAVDYNGYTITDLGAALTSTGAGLDLGGSAVWGDSINNNGNVVGRASFANTANYHAALWLNGTVYDLGVFGSPQDPSQTSEAHQITDSGLIVGEAYSDTTSTTNLYRQAAIFSVGNTPQNIHSAMTYNANNSVAVAAGNGYIVGQAYDDYAVYQHAVVWGNGTGNPSSYTTATDRNPQGIASTSPSAMSSINNSGQMVGWNIINPLGRFGYGPIIDPQDNQSATLWNTDGTVTYLDLSNDPRYTSIDFATADGVAVKINNAGQVLVNFTGFGNNIVNGLPGIWQKDGSFTEIPHVAGLYGMSPQSINDSGVVVGIANGSGGEHAVLYQNGAVIDLGALFEGSGWYLCEAWDINDKGQILVRASTTGFENPTDTLILTPDVTPSQPAVYNVTAAPTGSISIDSNGNYLVSLDITNNSNVALTTFSLTSATLNNTNATALPAAITAFSQGTSQTVNLTFPPTTGAPGTRTTLQVKGIYVEGIYVGPSQPAGTVSFSFREVLP